MSNPLPIAVIQPPDEASESSEGRDASALQASGTPSKTASSTMNPRSTINRFGIVSVGALLVFSGLALGGTHLLRQTAEEDPNAVVVALPVETVRVESVKSYPVVRRYTGAVAALRSSELGFERSGELVWLGADRGDRVEAGTAIARLDTRNLEAQRQQLQAQRAQALALLEELQRGPRSEDIAAAQAAVQDLENQLELEQLRASRRQFLYETGAVSLEEYNIVAFGADALSERLDGARNNLQELLNGTRSEQITAQQAVVAQLEAAIAEIEITIDKSTLKAPFPGILAARHMDEGTVTGAGQPVVRLVEAAQPEVEVGVPVDAMAQIQTGQRYSVEINQDRYDATVVSILPEVDPASRTRTVILTLNSPTETAIGSSLAPEQIAQLEVTQAIATDGYWLPTTALVRSERGLWSSYALVPPEAATEQPQNVARGTSDTYQLERRDVEVLHTEGDRVLVRGTLNPGDMVVANGTQRLVPGQVVRPVSVQSLDQSDTSTDTGTSP